MLKSDLTYLVNWLAGTGPFAFHLTNIVIHAINTALVYHLSARLIGASGGLRLSPASLAPLIVSLIFALHPVQTEAVTYISGRSSSLMALFWLASLAAYVRGSRAAAPLWLHVVSPLLFLLAVGSKETAVTLPPTLLLWEMAAGTGTWRQILRRQVVHWALLLAVLVVLVTHVSYGRLLVYGFGSRTLADNLLSQINGVFYLLSRLVLPHRLNIDPDLPVLSVWTPVLVGQGGILFLLAAIGLWGLRRRPWLGFGLLWFFLQLLPTNSLVPRLDVANERQLYLALIGPVLAGAVEAGRLGQRLGAGKAWGWAAVIAAVGLTMPFTILRNGDYRSEVALWRATARSSPDKARVLNNLGYAYHLAGCYDAAAAAYEKALRLAPGHTLAKNNLVALAVDRQQHRACGIADTDPLFP